MLKDGTNFQPATMRGVNTLPNLPPQALDGREDAARVWGWDLGLAIDLLIGLFKTVTKGWMGPENVTKKE